MEDKITLDRKTFKTLASDTRVGILKSLARRRKMLTELSKEFGMSPSTIKEHLENLSRAELVIQKDEGHKWKYYELTRKGKDVLNPGETKIWIVLTLSAIAILATTFDFAQRSFYGTFRTMSGGEMVAAPGAPAADIGTQALYTPYWHVIAFVVFSIILGVSLGYIFGKRRFYAFQGE
ncbi:MAG: winged helix-turn-helix transcriptional regulator [Candidatus Aenigmatarchaeota archaeon]|nr:MAG: winged helix-turn-helix transcriptional regulator [Candidatus Aenigmarchaeota archaeon]